MNELMTETQQLVIGVTVLLIANFGGDVHEMVLDWKENNKEVGESAIQNKDLYKQFVIWGKFAKQLVYGIFTPLNILFTVAAFLLMEEGYCTHEILPMKCPEINFSIQSNARLRFSILTNVNFPQHLNTLNHTEIVNIHYRTSLVNYKSNNSSYLCMPKNITVENRPTHCSSELKTASGYVNTLYELANSHHLGLPNGVLLQFPCHVTLQMHKVRSGVECRHRIILHLDQKSLLRFNYDFVYKLPESGSFSSEAPWSKLGKYSLHNTILNVLSEDNLEAFLSLFKDIDPDIMNVAAYSSPPSDLTVHEPLILQIECNRTCFCHECIMRGDLKRPTYCHMICPSRDQSDYKNTNKFQFCQLHPKSPDWCQAKWRSALDISKQTNTNLEDLLTEESPPNITAIFQGENLTAKFDPNLQFPVPGKMREIKFVTSSYPPVNFFLGDISPVVSIIPGHCESVRIGFFVACAIVALICLVLLICISVSFYKKLRARQTERHTQSTELAAPSERTTIVIGNNWVKFSPDFIFRTSFDSAGNRFGKQSESRNMYYTIRQN